MSCLCDGCKTVDPAVLAARPAVAKERVAAGATYLDDRVSGWADRINLDRLNISDEFNCIIGQLFGDWSKRPFYLDENVGDGLLRQILYGFNYSLYFDPAQVGPDQLEEAWKAEILERRAVPAFTPDPLL